MKYLLYQSSKEPFVGSYPCVLVWLNQWGKGFYNIGKEPKIMQTEFTIELTADIDANDEARRKAFIDLAIQTAKQFYAQSTMISSSVPKVSVSEVGRKGKVDHPLFKDNTP